MNSRFRSGGWLLLALLLVCLSTVVFLGGQRLIGGWNRPVGDGSDPSSYGFDLTHLAVDPDLLVSSGQPRDGLRALVDPPVMDAGGARHWRENHRGKYLVPADRVIGVVRNGQARAYPLRVLNWHEIVNDHLGGDPIAVTYNPLCDSAVVFSRRRGEEVMEFGFSGLLYDSNLLLYDRRPAAGDSSLWSQLLFRAISGPRRGAELEVLTSSVVRWDVWLSAYPDTTVLEPDPRLKHLYKRDPYEPYFGDERLRFPVPPLPHADRRLKTPLLVLLALGHERVLSHDELAQITGTSGRTEISMGDIRVGLQYTGEPSTVLVQPAPDGAPLGTVHCFRFAWEALHPPR